MLFGHNLQLSDIHPLCCTDTIVPIWTRHVDAW